MNQFLSGAIVAGDLVVMLLFLRFWRDTRDRLFAIFGGAFALLALQRVLLAVTGDLMENAALLYLPRLLAFAVILWAIIDKNREPRK